MRFAAFETGTSYLHAKLPIQAAWMGVFGIVKELGPSSERIAMELRSIPSQNSTSQSSDRGFNTVLGWLANLRGTLLLWCSIRTGW